VTWNIRLTINKTEIINRDVYYNGVGRDKLKISILSKRDTLDLVEIIKKNGLWMFFPK